MLQLRTLATGLTFVLALLIAPSSQALFMDSEAAYLIAHPGDTWIDFEGVAAPGGYAAIPADLFAGLLLGPTPYIDSASFSDGSFPAAPSDYLCSCSFDLALTIDFLGPVTSVGFRLASAEANNAASPGASVTVNVYNGSSLLDSQTFFANNVDLLDTFAGFDGLSSSITRVEIVPGASNQVILLDDLRYGTGGSGTGVPEPTAAVLALTGLLGLALRGRSRLR